MKRHRITFMLAEANPLEKRILAWIEGLRADRGVPLKVHLVPVLARGLGLTDEAMVGHAPARDKKPARRRSEPITHESGPAKAAEMPRVKSSGSTAPAVDEEFPLDRLELD